MKVIMGSEKYRLKNSHPYAEAIVALAKAYPGNSDLIPERNDIKQLWRELRDSHKLLLTEIANHPGGISQSDLEASLELNWEGLRGVHNGLARICESHGVEKPVRVLGYNATNRQYIMDPDAIATVKKLSN